MVLALALCRSASAQEASESLHEGDLSTRDALTGNWGGKRSSLEDSGILLGADSIDEVFGNVSGGIGTGAIYEGRLEFLATLNLEKLIGWDGATFHVNAYQIRGRGLSANDLGNNLATASNIEAGRSTRLFDLWVEQVLFQGMVSVRAGQIAADDEFFTSQYAASFVNATFGWPALMSSNLPSGGPAYPLATPGLRVSVAPTDELTFSAAVLNGDPAGAGPGDPQQRDASGTAFRFDDGAFAIGEASYAINQQKDASGLPATFKLGAWYHTGKFADQRFDDAGLSLAAPNSSGLPATHRSDYGVYAVIDQSVWIDPDNADRNIGLFFRAGGSPPDRNEVSLYADAGLNFKGLVAGRTDDVFGLAAAVVRIGSSARALDADIRRFGGLDTPVRDSETVIEMTYRYQVTPWWSVQPDIQFIRHPGGSVSLPADPTRPIPDALLFGMRSAVLF
ncbi:MAG TPA: carbohydrate porin [Aliidongia sp.]|nr:carbohydrate porin [Aliidongia sp.]